ncbi:MAG: DUF5652 family protein [Patescibacteria group bacterium]
MMNFWGNMMGGWGAGAYGGWWGGMWFLMPLLLIWSLFWKAWATWIAARKGNKIWFGALLAVNTFGILEILYIYVFSKMKVKDIFGSAPEIKK